MAKNTEDGTAAPAAPPSDAQPTEFPVSFEEWDSAQPAGTRVMRAGFRHAVRQQGRLQQQQRAKKWNEDFDKFLAAPPQ